MRCLKCKRLVAEAVLGECHNCIMDTHGTELNFLRKQLEYLRDRVRELERENFRLRSRDAP